MNGRLLAATLVWLLALAVPAAAQLVPIDSFKQPVHATTAPGDYHRLYVVEKAGVIRAHHFDHTHGDAFLDLSAQVLNEREAGMFSMAFPPDHRASGKFYVAYADRGGDVRVQEVSARGPDEADPASRRDVLTVEHSATKIHFGGQLQFRDGFLWLSLGDASVRANGQNDATRLGKLLRIDPATGAVETFGKGLRNPWRFSFDRATGDLLLSDVGLDNREEVNFVPAGQAPGLNFGWACMEGDFELVRGCAANLVLHAPALVKSHDAGYCSITGGYVVRDPASPYHGRYMYSDYCSNTIRTAALGPAGAGDDRPTDMRVPEGRVVSFAEDNCGRMFVMSLAGPLYQVGNSPCSAPPEGPVDPPPPAPGPALPPVAQTTTPQPTPGGGAAQRAPGAGLPARAPGATREASSRPPALLVLKVARRQRGLARGMIALRVRCAKACTVRATAALAPRRGRTRRLPTTRVALVGGRSATLRLRIPRALRRARALRASLTVTARPRSGGRSATLRRTIQLTR